MGKNKYITSRILSTLQNYVECRDSYMLTIQKLHQEEINFMRKDQSDYFKLFFDKKLSSVNTIIRMWRKIQEVHIELRGINWEQRQVQSAEFRNKINVYGKDQLHLFDNLEILNDI
jgi:hypothetical protein